MPTSPGASPPGDFSPLPDQYLSAYGLAVSPDGSTVAANQDWHRKALNLSHTSGTITWDAASGQVATRLDNGYLGAVAWHPDGELLAVSDHDIALIEGEVRWSLRGHGASAARPGVVDLAFSRDGQRLASAGRDGTIRVWDTRPGMCQPGTLIQVADPRSVSFSPDGSRVAIGSAMGCSVWDAATGASVSVSREVAEATAAAFTPDGSLVAAGPNGLWHVNTSGKVTAGPPSPHKDPRYLACGPSGQVACAAWGESRLLVWEPTTRKNMDLRAPGVVGRIAWAPTGSLFVCSPTTGVATWAAGRWSRFGLP